MSHAIAGLRAGVAAILAAQGDADLSTIVENAEVELVGAPDVWSLGSRTAVAHRVALILEPAAFVELRRDPARREAVRDAFAAAMRSPGTELAELALVLKLPGIAQPWRRAYREAVPRQTPERPGDAAVLAGAAALLEAAGDSEGAAALPAWPHWPGSQRPISASRLASLTRRPTSAPRWDGCWTSAAHGEPLVNLQPGRRQ